MSHKSANMRSDSSLDQADTHHMSSRATHNDTRDNSLNTSASDQLSAGLTALPLNLRAVIAFTFFSMIFGAGNLIFPPFVGAQAGSTVIPATIGFIISAVGLPVLGVWVVCKAGGFDAIGSRVSPVFAKYFGIIVLLAIGPFLAIPRTATTSLEIAVTPFTSQFNSHVVTLIYSAVFFIAAFFLAQHPEKLSGKLGRITGPILLVMILVLFVLVVMHPAVTLGKPMGYYTTNQFAQGILDGYQTMDLIAAMYLGLVVSTNARALGSAESHKHKEVAIGGIVAGIFLIVIYSILSYLGTYSNAVIPIDPKTQNGANVLTNLTNHVLGPVGVVLLGAIFVVACFNVCTGLIALCSTYFSQKCANFGSVHVSYRTWTVIFSIISFAVANLGLSQIITFSVPVLIAIYPIAIVLILLTMVEKLFGIHVRKVFQWTAYTVGVLSVFNFIDSFIAIFNVHTLLTTVLNYLPLHSIKFDWIIPAVIAMAIGYVHSALTTRTPQLEDGEQQAESLDNVDVANASAAL